MVANLVRLGLLLGPHRPEILLPEGSCRGFLVLQLGPSFGVRLVDGKSLYLQSAVEEMCASAVFTEKYLQRCR